MKRGTPDHFKTRRLQKLLRLPKYSAVGLLECLFHVAQTHARAGDIGRLTDGEISHSLGWGGAPARLIGALIEAGWLDSCECHRLRVHDWPQHADQTVKKGIEKVGLAFLHCYASSGTVPEPVGNGSALPLPLPKPKPEPKPIAPAARVTWMTPYSDAWKERLGGEPSYGKLAKFLRPLDAKHGPGETLSRWVRYLAETPAEYASPSRFAETFGRWAVGDPGSALVPARASPPSPAAQRRRESMAAAIMGGMKGDKPMGES